MTALFLAASLLSSIPAAIDRTEQTYADGQAVSVLAHRVLELEAQVAALKRSRGHRTEWVVESIAGKGFDWLTTGVAMHAGRGRVVEGNSLLPTEEIRLGAGALAIALQYGLVELINVLFGDRAAVWVSRGITVGYAGLGFHNLHVANQNARGR